MVDKKWTFLFIRNSSIWFSSGKVTCKWRNIPNNMIFDNKERLTMAIKDRVKQLRQAKTGPKLNSVLK